LALIAGFFVALFLKGGEEFLDDIYLEQGGEICDS
jgi:hypothetical protein